MMVVVAGVEVAEATVGLVVGGGVRHAEVPPIYCSYVHKAIIKRMVISILRPLISDLNLKKCNTKICLK